MSNLIIGFIIGNLTGAMFIKWALHKSGFMEKYYYGHKPI